jgi:hypothetical protein
MKLAILAFTIALVLTAAFACVHIDPKCCATFCAPQPPCASRPDAGPEGE